jgi:hypothetical protein
MSSKITIDRIAVAPEAFAILSSEAFAILGGSKVAYVKTIRSEDAAVLYPDAPLLAPGQIIFALHAADGTPITLAESRESAVADAASYQLETLSLH